MTKQEPERPTILLSKQGKGAAEKAAELRKKLVPLNTPVEFSTLPVDCVWTAPVGLIMLDFKTPSDLIASVNDGRLSTQSETMQAKHPARWGFFIEHQPGEDGITLGHGTHAWNVERFDNLCCSIAEDGGVVIHAAPHRAAQRLQAYYLRSLRTQTATWKEPNPHKGLNNPYTDLTYRAQVEMLMCLPGIGEQKANDLLDRWPLVDLLGIDPTKLEWALENWGRVKGLGKKTISQVRNFIEEDFSSDTLREETVNVAG